jgi:hypothetical protein
MDVVNDEVVLYTIPKSSLYTQRAPNAGRRRSIDRLIMRLSYASGISNNSSLKYSTQAHAHKI